MADPSITRSFMPADTIAQISSNVSAAIDMQLALRYLLRHWDATEGPQVIDDHIGTMEACLDRSEKALRQVSVLLPDQSPEHMLALPVRGNAS